MKKIIKKKATLHPDTITNSQKLLLTATVAAIAIENGQTKNEISRIIEAHTKILDMANRLLVDEFSGKKKIDKKIFKQK